MHRVPIVETIAKSGEGGGQSEREVTPVRTRGGGVSAGKLLRVLVVSKQPQITEQGMSQ